MSKAVKSRSGPVTNVKNPSARGQNERDPMLLTELTAKKTFRKPKPPLRAALASWVELLNSQAGGGRNYEDVGSIFTLRAIANNTAK